LKAEGERKRFKAQKPKEEERNQEFSDQPEQNQ
jgi:hypothetical protein